LGYKKLVMLLDHQTPAADDAQSAGNQKLLARRMRLPPSLLGNSGSGYRGSMLIPVSGKLKCFVTSKDIIPHIFGEVGVDDAAYWGL